MLLWVLLLAAGIFFIYRRHDNQEADAAPAATPHAAPPSPADVGSPIAPGINIHHGGGITAARYAHHHHHHHHDCGCDLGDVSTWEDADEDVPMYAIAPQHSYGDVGAIG
jgi:ABC-type nickel/cobalt efflux system permease component RcnA